MGFDFSNVDPSYKPRSAGATLLPKGVWRLAIEHAEEKATAKGDSYTNMLFRVVEPPDYEGMKFYDMFMTSGKGAEWGNNRLSAIAHAVGVIGGEYDDLYNKEFITSTYVEKSTDPKYGDKTRVDRIYWRDGEEIPPLGPKGPPPEATAAVQRPVVVASNPAPAPAAGRPWAAKR